MAWRAVQSLFWSSSKGSVGVTGWEGSRGPKRLCPLRKRPPPPYVDNNQFMPPPTPSFVNSSPTRIALCLHHSIALIAYISSLSYRYTATRNKAESVASNDRSHRTSNPPLPIAHPFTTELLAKALRRPQRATRPLQHRTVKFYITYSV